MIGPLRLPIGIKNRILLLQLNYRNQ